MILVRPLRSNDPLTDRDPAEAHRRRRWKRILIGGGIVTTLAGAVMLAYPLYTDVEAGKIQGRLAEQFASRTLGAGGNASPNAPLYRIQIKAIGLDTVIVQGTDAKALRAGAGHYTQTAPACEAGNVAIAGHRTTFGKPFNRLDQLRPGDEIKLSTPEKSCLYRVTILDSERASPRPNRSTAAWVTGPYDTSVLAPTSEPMLTLTTCHPKGSDNQRLILRAKMQNPRDAQPV